MLAEARGFRVAMTLAHQHLGQLPRELREGLSTNARNKIFFNASPEDAGKLAHHTAPRLSDHDLAHLGAYHAAVRLVVNSEEAQPFTIRTQPLPDATPGRAREIRALARRALHTRAATRAPSHSPQPGSRPPQRSGTASAHSRPTTGNFHSGLGRRNADPRR
jgi:hypothetical protein